MLTIHSETSTLEITPSGTISGVIALRGEEYSFPDDDWNDAPVVVLGWWLEELIRLHSGHASTVQCRFMDGPFSFDVKRDGDEINLRCLRRRPRSEQVVIEERVRLDAFIRELVASASRVVTACEERGWSSIDLNHLKDLVRAAASQVGTT